MGHVKALQAVQYGVFPEYVDAGYFGDFCVPILRIGGMAGQPLIPLAEGASLLTDSALLATVPHLVPMAEKERETVLGRVHADLFMKG